MGEITKFVPNLVLTLLVLLFISLLGAKILVQRHDLITARERNVQLTKDNGLLDATIKQLQEVEEDNKKRLAKLQTDTRRITQTLTEREAIIESLQHADPQLQSWSDTPLPDTIIRLRHRPAAIGAADYHPELPDRQPVLSASGQSEN